MNYRGTENTKEERQRVRTQDLTPRRQAAKVIQKRNDFVRLLLLLLFLILFFIFGESLRLGALARSLSVFSVFPPLRSLCLCGSFFPGFLYANPLSHRRAGAASRSFVSGRQSGRGRQTACPRRIPGLRRRR